MHKGQAQRGQCLDHMREQELWCVVACVVGGRHGRETDACAIATDLGHHGLHHFLQKAGAVLDVAAIGVVALVAAAAQELVDQVAVGRVHFHAIKAGGHRIARGVAVVLHDAGQLTCIERARLGGVHELGLAIDQQNGFGFGGDGRGRHRRCAPGLQAGVRDTAHVPQLHDDLAALGVHGVGHLFPGGDLLGAPDARHVGVALALVADGGGLGDDQPGPGGRVGALAVVGRHAGIGQRAGRAVARERGHDDAGGQAQCASGEGVKQGGHVCFVGGEGQTS